MELWLGLGNTWMTSQNAFLRSWKAQIIWVWSRAASPWPFLSPSGSGASYLLIAQQLCGLERDIKHHSQLHSVRGPFPPSIKLCLLFHQSSRAHYISLSEGGGSLIAHLLYKAPDTPSYLYHTMGGGCEQNRVYCSFCPAPCPPEHMPPSVGSDRWYFGLGISS